MRYHVALITALALPASAGAHTGLHDGMGPVAALVHLLSQHYALGFAGVLVAVLLSFGLVRAQRSSCKARPIRIRRKEPCR